MGAAFTKISQKLNRIFTVSADGLVKTWDLKNFEFIKSYKNVNGFPKSIAINPNGESFIIGFRFGRFSFWNLNDQKPLILNTNISVDIREVEFSPDGKTFAVANHKDVNIYKTDSKDLIRKIESHSTSINSISFSPNGKYLVSGSNDGLAKVWDIKSGTLMRTFESDQGNVKRVFFDLSGENIFLLSREGSLIKWNYILGTIF